MLSKKTRIEKKNRLTLKAFRVLMRSEHSFGNRIFLTEGRIIVQTKGQERQKNIENKWNYINHCCCFFSPQRTKESGRFSHCAHSNQVNLYAH